MRMNVKKNLYDLCILSISLSFLPGCNMLEQLSNVGEPPEIPQIQDPTRVKDYQPVTMPMPTPEEKSVRINSLWQSGSRAFFKDQRARRVGDIITVDISFNNEAKIEDKLQTSRTVKNNSSIPNFFGYDKYYKKVFPSTVDPKHLTNISTSSTVDGEGQRTSKDKVEIKIAATIIQVLPNGNMVIQGRREVRISGEVRMIELKGIIRREDILAGNRIRYAKISQARLSDVSKGEISDLSSTPWGQEVLNKILPF